MAWPSRPSRRTRGRIVNGDRARALDAGHGLELTFDLSRYSPAFPVDGDASLHFGRTRDANLVPITYNWPGGAHGTMESRTFSLEGYSAADKPVLYFNYFAATEQESSDPATQTPMLDSLRVFIDRRERPVGHCWPPTTRTTFSATTWRLGPNIGPGTVRPQQRLATGARRTGQLRGSGQPADSHRLRHGRRR